MSVFCCNFGRVLFVSPTQSLVSDLGYSVPEKSYAIRAPVDVCPSPPCLRSHGVDKGGE